MDFSRTLRQIIDLYEPAFADRRHHLDLDLQHGVIIDADRALLNRTLSNLLENELNHLPPGCTIEIRLRSQDGAAELVVGDNGPGFPPDIRTRAFERFVKGKQSPGTGLGLLSSTPLFRHMGAVPKSSISLIVEPSSLFCCPHCNLHSLTWERGQPAPTCLRG